MTPTKRAESIEAMARAIDGARHPTPWTDEEWAILWKTLFRDQISKQAEVALDAAIACGLDKTDRLMVLTYAARLADAEARAEKAEAQLSAIKNIYQRQPDVREIFELLLTVRSGTKMSSQERSACCQAERGVGRLAVERDAAIMQAKKAEYARDKLAAAEGFSHEALGNAMDRVRELEKERAVKATPTEAEQAIYPERTVYHKVNSHTLAGVLAKYDAVLARYDRELKWADFEKSEQNKIIDELLGGEIP
jgi:hypothetical protein